VPSGNLSVRKAHPNFHLGIERIDSGLEVGIDLGLRGVDLVLGICRCNGNQCIGKAVGIILRGLKIALDERAQVIGVEVRLLALHGIQGCLYIGE
jgi:hypothetical protein